MKIPMKLTFINVPITRQLETLLYEEVNKLEEICDSIFNCSITIEKSHHDKKTKNVYRVGVEIKVPHGDDIVVFQEIHGGNIYLGAIHNIMNSARCKILQYNKLQQKIASLPIQNEYGGIIIKLNKQEGDGFLLNTNGREIYFSCDSVIGDEFLMLEEGMSVWYVEKENMKGPYASLVKVIKPIS